jgi:3-dehydroquinate synthase
MLGDGLKNVIEHPPKLNLDLIMEKFNNDKKHRTDFYRMVVPKSDGELALISADKIDDVRKNIELAYQTGLANIAYPIT